MSINNYYSRLSGRFQHCWLGLGLNSTSLQCMQKAGDAEKAMR